MPDLGGMFSGFFEAVATLALLFIIVGWVSSKLVEVGQALFNWHGNMLRDELERCFGGEEARDFTRYFYWHPLVAPLSQPRVLKLPEKLRPGEAPEGYPRDRLPAYIAPETFAAAMLNPFPWPVTKEPLEELIAGNRDGTAGSPSNGELARQLATDRSLFGPAETWQMLLGRTTSVVGSFDPEFLKCPVDIHSPVPRENPVAGLEHLAGMSLLARLAMVWQRNKLVPSGLRTRILALLQDAEGDIDRLRSGIARWYGETMDRVTGRFKRRTLSYVLACALAICLAFNLDGIRIFTSIVDHADRRASIDRIRSMGGGSELATLDAKREFADRLSCLEDKKTEPRQCAKELLERLWRNAERPSPIGGMSFRSKQDDVEAVQHYCLSEKRSEFCSTALAARLQTCVAADPTPRGEDEAEQAWLKRHGKETNNQDWACASAWSAIWKNPGFFWNASAAERLASFVTEPSPDPATLSKELTPMKVEIEEQAKEVDKIVDPVPGAGLIWRTWDASGFWPSAAAILGICLSALLAALGAPFWYDLLGRISRRGTTGPKPGAS